MRTFFLSSPLLLAIVLSVPVALYIRSDYFTGDLQKYQILAEPTHTTLEKSLEALPSLVAARLNIAGKLLANDLLDGMWAEFQQLVWRLWLLVLVEAKEGVSKEDEIREAIRAFLLRWNPFSNLTPSFNPIIPSPGRQNTILPIT